MTATDIEAAEQAVRDRLSLLWHLDIEDHGVTMMLELMGVPSIDHVTPALLEGATTLRPYNLMTLSQTELFVGTQEVCDVMNIAAPLYPDTKLFLSDVLVPFGMVWFVEPIDDPAPFAKIPIRALSWTITQPGESVLRLLGRTHDKPVLTILGYTDVKALPHKAADIANQPTLYPVVSVLWEVDSDTGGILYDPTDREMAETMRSPYVKLLMAFWSVMRQRLFTSDPPIERVSPKQIKQARRRNPALNDTIHIVRMKPKASTTYTGDHGFNRPNWQNQWVVRPHWRDQWYPATQEHKPYLIWSYIKGPSGKPLKGAERAFLPPKEK